MKGFSGWFRRNNTIMAQAKDLKRQLQEAWDECEKTATLHTMSIIEVNDNLELARSLTAQLHRVARERDNERKLRLDTQKALHAFMNHVPENWGDEVQDGYIQLSISADTIDEIEEAIAKGK